MPPRGASTREYGKERRTDNLIDMISACKDDLATKDGKHIEELRALIEEASALSPPTERNTSRLISY